MNSLLKRQLRKYLTPELASHKDLQKFIDAIERSYTNYDEQFTMLQRAMSISSDELFTANQNLKQKAASQQEIITKLKRVLETLKFYELPEDINTEIADIDGLKLAEFIDNQTKEIIKINTEREKLLQDLEIQNNELSDYAHMVSHDLKSPLRSIDTLITWLKEDHKEVLNDAGKEQINLIRTNVEKMDALISGILEYSAISQKDTNLYTVNTDNVLDGVINGIMVPDHISIIRETPLPIVKGDKYRLQQLFQNLISNAIKYNDKDNGTIAIGVEDKNSYWVFYIRDNGKGIEKAYFDKIFQTFQKLENNSQSSGIGLSIVKKIVNFYNEKIWVESEVNKGTTFYFTFKKV